MSPRHLPQSNTERTDDQKLQDKAREERLARRSRPDKAKDNAAEGETKGDEDAKVSEGKRVLCSFACCDKYLFVCLSGRLTYPVCRSVGALAQLKDCAL